MLFSSSVTGPENSEVFDFRYTRSRKEVVLHNHSLYLQCAPLSSLLLFLLVRSVCDFESSALVPTDLRGGLCDDLKLCLTLRGQDLHCFRGCRAVPLKAEVCNGISTPRNILGLRDECRLNDYECTNDINQTLAKCLERVKGSFEHAWSMVSEPVKSVIAFYCA